MNVLMNTVQVYLLKQSALNVGPNNLGLKSLH